MTSPLSTGTPADPAATSGRWEMPHSVEYQIQRQLQSDPHLQISGLCVHRTPDGVCVEGLLHEGDQASVHSLIKAIVGDLPVHNRIVCQTSPTLPNLPR